MSRFPKGFLLGTATAAHQVEGNNIHSDNWAMEQLPHSANLEPSLDAVDHYNRYEEDIKLMADAGMNAYRFTIEWARIQPTPDAWEDAEVEHYRKVLECCHANGITPMVTLHHFSSPKWLIQQGGWEAADTVEHFAAYARRIVAELGELMVYVNTINEANMGLQIGKMVQNLMKRIGSTSDVQVGMNMPSMENYMLQKQEAKEVFGCEEQHVFHSPRTQAGDEVIIRAHEKARDAIKAVRPELKVGISLSLHDIQALPGGESIAENEWAEEFTHYLPFIQNDDFLGVQSYTRKQYDENGSVQPGPDVRLTQMGYEDYPQAVVNVTRRVAQDFSGDLIITENGIATDDDSRRIEFIQEALDGLEKCIEDGIPVKGYLYWSLMDNYEWALAYTRTFGLIAVDRSTQTRYPKPSLAFLGSQR